MSMKIFDEDKLRHELLLRTRQKAKLTNAFKNNMSANKTFSKKQISDVFQSGGFLGTLWSKIPDQITKVAGPGPLAKNILAPLGIIKKRQK